MKFVWSTAKPAKVQNAYLDWFDHVYQPGSSGAFGYELTFVQIKKTGQPASFENTLNWLAKEADTATAKSGFTIDNVERQLLAEMIENPPLTEPPAFFLHRRKSKRSFAKTYKDQFSVIPYGAARPQNPQSSVPTDPMPSPVVAVIDDAIGYLNKRFSNRVDGSWKTRLHKIWLQTEDELVANDGVTSMQNGVQLSAKDIDALLSRGDALDESAQYAAMNETLFGKRISPIWNGITAGAGSELASTHGTHVTDIAAGADPFDDADPMLDCPMLAVQLPPQAIEDTSGSKLQPFVVRALRWVIAQADGAVSDGAYRPLVVNISLGVLAGSKDGTSLIERQIAAEVLNREARTGMPMRVVFAFGNDNLTRQIGYMELKKKKRQSVTLRVQSEDYTPSFVEFHAERPEDLQLEIACLQADKLDLGSIAAGKSVSLNDQNGLAVARVYSMPAMKLIGGGQTAPHYVLAIAPTASFEGGKPLAPSGPWDLTLASLGSEQAVRIGVQRDDRPLGFQELARQSYLDDTPLWQWKPPVKSKFALPADGPVTSIGTHSAWLSAKMIEQVYSVGAALGDTGFAAPYSATGAPYTKPEPTVSTIGDSSWTLRGLMASGTLSGTTTVMSGTSVAAPQITRELALLFASNPNIGPWNAPDVNAAAEMKALAKLEWSFVPTYQIDQLGPLNVSREAGVRPRLDQGY